MQKPLLELAGRKSAVISLKQIPPDPGASMSKSRPLQVNRRPPSPENARLVDLLSEIGKHNRSAFAELYSLTGKKLLGLAVKMTGNREVGEEILQESFLTIWKKARLYQPDLGSPMAWLSTIVRHRAIDRMRLARHSSEIAIGGHEELDLISPPSYDPCEAKGVIGPTIVRCLQHLMEKRRHLILMAFHQGFTHDELSSRTGLPLGTVKSEVRRGLADLRQCLQK